MKKCLILLVALGMFMCSTNAFALAYSYNQTVSFMPEVTVNYGNVVDFPTFTGLTANLLEAELILHVAGATDGEFKIAGFGNLGGVGTATTVVAGGAFTGPGDYTFSSTGTLDLATLNSAITSGNLNLSFEQLVGSTRLSGATLRGNLAPEPASMALMAAGLVGLSFARRFRKSLS